MRRLVLETNKGNENQKKELIKKYAEVAADAYVKQYFTDQGVMGDPVIVYDSSEKTFSRKSELSPLSSDEKIVDKIEEGCFGEVEGEDTEEIKQDIFIYLTEYADMSFLFEKL
jgi:hypothetical protein